MPLTPQQIAERYRAGVAGAATKYREGVQNPKRSWAQGYVASADKMAMNYQRALAEGTPQRAVQQLGDAGWQQKTIDKATHYTQSADRAAQGYAQIADQVLRAGDAARSAAASISPGGFEQSVEKVRASMRAMKQAWNKPID